MADGHDPKGEETGKYTPIALTPEEFVQLRHMLATWERTEKMLVTHERVEWFWATLGVWVKWIGAIGAGLVAAKLLLGDFKELLKTWLTVR